MPLPVLSRREYLAAIKRQWNQGEHIAIIGQTGTGKTTIARDLLQARDWVVAIAIKRHDDTLTSFRRDYDIVKRWPPAYGQRRVVLWIKPRGLNDVTVQRAKVLDALEDIYIAGGWCTYFDDLSYITDQLNIKTPITTFFNQGRSSGLSCVSAVTRPRKVPLEAFTQVRHQLIFRFFDPYEIDRCAEIAGISRYDMREWQKDLGEHDFIGVSRGQPVMVR